eukprot:TRINITY_DN33508_c0_g1_i1.p1 TRINITY_DN33508_c0_g1~~TRINITY_DN33508_c0_g1_i1.p1  ORF type:complete len:205 (+),score=2.38 TRINITY_DN33508_c0_g1_i1:183-797(+)
MLGPMIPYVYPLAVMYITAITYHRREMVMRGARVIGTLDVARSLVGYVLQLITCVSAVTGWIAVLWFFVDTAYADNLDANQNSGSQAILIACGQPFVTIVWWYMMRWRRKGTEGDEPRKEANMHKEANVLLVTMGKELCVSDVDGDYESLKTDNMEPQTVQMIEVECASSDNEESGGGPQKGITQEAPPSFLDHRVTMGPRTLR